MVRWKCGVFFPKGGVRVSWRPVGSWGNLPVPVGRNDKTPFFLNVFFPENVWQHGNTHILRRGLLGHIEV